MGFDIGNIFQDFATSLPGIGSIFDDSDENLMQELRKNQDLYAGINVPSYSDYNPEDYGYSGDLRPEDAQATQISEDPGVRTAQLSALSKMAGLANTGMSDIDQAGYEKARQLGGQMARSGTQAAMQNAAARGLAGSGMEFMLREQANQDGAQNAQNAGLQQAADSARQRALYQSAYNDGLSNLRSQDYTKNAANSNILNQFNMANTKARNDAQQGNLQNRQTVMNANTTNRNNAQQYNNDLRLQNFQNQITRAGGMSNANAGMANGFAAQNAARTSARNANTDAIMKILGAAKGGGA